VAISSLSKSSINTFDKFNKTGVGAFASQFLVTGASGTVLTSPDGITWTSRSGLPSQTITAPHRNGNLLCVFASSIRYTSVDGVTWAKNGQIALNAGSSIGIANSASFNTVDRTTNLFSRAAVASDNGYMFDVTNAVSIGDAGVVGSTVQSTGYATNGSIFMWSGGVTGSAYLWKSTTTKGGALSLQAYGSSATTGGVAFGNNIWVVGDNGANTGLYSSPDTTTWTSRGTFAQYVVFLNGQFLAWAAQFLYTSTDGITWTQRTPPNLLTKAIHQITFGNGVYVLVGASGYIATSTNGATWTERTSGTANVLNGVCFA
jgi:hypothetical protein